MVWIVVFVLCAIQLARPVRYDAVKQSTGYFWHIDSANLNLNFSIQGDRTKNCVYAPNVPLHLQPAKPFGDPECDPPAELIRSAAHFMKAVRGEEVDFILWTGDTSPNTGVMSEDQVKKYIREMTLLLREEFPLSSVYPVLGDRDFYPPGQPNTEMYKFAADLWENWLPPTAVQTLRKGGYYQVELAGRRLQLIGLNTPIWSQENQLVGEEYGRDPGLQFYWLEKVLEKAKAKKQTVILFGHSPPGVFEAESRGQTRYWYQSAFNTRYKQLVVKYSNVIIGQFFGHQNTDAFRLFYNNKKEPVSWALISPGLTFRSLIEGSPGPIASPPSLRLYRYNTYDGQILDYSQFSLYLDQPTSTAAGWRLQYNFSSQYRLGGVTAVSLDQLYESFHNRERRDLFDSYLWSSMQQPPLTCDSSCRVTHLCAIPNIEYSGFRNCLLAASGGSGAKVSKPNIALTAVLWWVCLQGWP